MRRLTTTLAVLTTLALTMMALLAVRTTAAASVEPIFRDDLPSNAECSALGYAYGTKIDNPVSTTYSLDGVNTVTLAWQSSSSVDWLATIGIDAVVMKAGDGANVYFYNPEQISDTGLVTPDDKEISHITFCYDYELTATKTADGEFTRTYAWSISKSAAPGSHSGFAGEKFSSDYAVVVDKTTTDSDFAVVGTITVHNPTPFTVGFTVSDSVGGTAATVACDTYSLAPGASTTCNYSAALGDTSPGDGTNIATITSLNSSVAGATASDGYSFGSPTTTNGYDKVNVTDSVQGSLGEASGDKTFTYSDEFVCPSDPAAYTDGVYTKTFPNTATILETSQSANAGVDLACYAPLVSKTAETSFDRAWDWTIEKTGDRTELLLSAGQSFLVNYDVMVSATKTDTGHLVRGVITVINPSPSAMEVTLSDTLPGGSAAIISADADCALVGNVLTISANSTATCGYESSGLTGPISGNNVATATLNAIDFTGTAAVAFGAPTNEHDECIDVTDSKYGALGTVCAGDAPKTFEYSLNVGPYDTCGEYTFTNTASFVTNDTGAAGEDSWDIAVSVPCLGGCTLTQGYWKTHSKYGPAPYDNTWALLPNGADTPFFLSGQTWIKVFGTAPAGNAYYNLAHQYMAAKLNVLNGASTTPAVAGAIGSAETLFNAYTPAQIGALRSNNAIRKQFVDLAAILDSYNNGLTGPGHCSE